jgi:hypothetical protein
MSASDFLCDSRYVRDVLVGVRRRSIGGAFPASSVRPWAARPCLTRKKQPNSSKRLPQVPLSNDEPVANRSSPLTEKENDHDTAY